MPGQTTYSLVGWNVRGSAACVAAGAALLASAPAAAAHGFAATPPRNLTTEHAGTTVQVDVSHPRLSWQGADGAQTAYEVALSDARRVVWDSGKVSSADET